MDRKEFENKKREQFNEFLEILETMDYGTGQKDFIDNFYTNFFNSIYDEGAYMATQRVLKKNEIRKK
ncbi:hypothetical protein [Lysinibacillus sphaericus]|uniref:hypothetical protein n=1 Tax=Lysinibacillus sphaericus TaxID=1421 RepID=UPI0018CD9DDD|nr:hypothetical protein [Lysinibacillus sphaericus]MBG9479385.1 hypothetical protein [Lysinibacillus sphaericus]MBG9479434.1 hypothetical protein [Lysinibacillus sphaericus]